MSAIAGLINRTGKPVEASDLKRMGTALNAHGECEEWRKGTAGLLQCRSLTTPGDRQQCQPAASDKPAGALVSASRLTNRAALAQELGLEASLARISPDSLFIWQSYLKWGSDCFRHLIGDYTFAVWDEAADRLVITASPFSTQPLHYCDSLETFAFATMPKGLFALRDVPRVLDEEYVSKYLARTPRAPNTTFYRGIHRLLPGQTLVVEGGRPLLLTDREWEPESELRFSSDAEYEEAFLDLYARVVQDHLHLDHVRTVTPVGIMLSGGLDSSSLAAMAAPLLGAQNARLSAFTEAPRSGFSLPASSARYADEVERVQSIAGLYDNIDVNILRPDGSHFLRHAASYFQHVEIPFRNACNRPWIEAILGTARSQGVEILLMGNMGNSTVSWTGEGADQNSADQNSAKTTWKNVLRHSVLPALPPPLRQAAFRLRGYAASLASPPRASLLRPELARKYGIETSRGENIVSASRDDRDGSYQRWEQLRRTTAQSATLWTGYQSMFGVEVRDPTGDERIIRFCLALPPDQFSRDGVSRRLIRRTMAGRLPDEILSSRRRGLQSADWLLTLVGAQDELRAELDRIEHCEIANHLMDLAALRRSLDSLTQTADPMDIGLRNFLEHGLMTGRFLSWVETGR